MRALDSWTTNAACRPADSKDFFADVAGQKRAKTVCVACLVRTECLAEALDNRIEFGVWGGMTERERRALLRRCPEVNSWRAVLDSARRNYVHQRLG
ncbi:WhiB family transcriptional regulator [Streptomyces sp. NPDC055709]